MGKRVQGIPAIFDLETRFRSMDPFDEYTQLLSIASPPVAVFFGPERAVEMSRIGNDEAVIQGILSPDLQKAIALAEQKDDAYTKKNPDEEPPLGDGIPWQSSPDYAATCDIGLATLSKHDAKVEIKYGFPDDPKANYVDTLILKKIDQPGFDVGFWRIDDVVYPDGTDLKASLISAFDGTE